MKKPVIVIPLHEGGGKFKDNSELRWALRSIAANFDEASYEVAIVGKKLPPWVRGIRWIEQRDGGLKTALRMAANAYPDGFFWFYDDCCILKKITAHEMKVTPCSKGWGRPQTPWAEKLHEVKARLEREGIKAWDFSHPHGPYWFNKSMIDESFADWPGMDGKLPFETWILSKRNWRRRHSGWKQYYGEFKNAPGDFQQYLNYNNAGFTEELRAWLGTIFPEPCPFERPPVEIRSDIRLRAVVIGLAARPRWENACIEDMAAAGIDCQVVPGFDGHAAGDPPMRINAGAFKKDFKREPLPGEIGCWASHFLLAKQYDSLPPLADCLPDWRVTFEDDAIPNGMDAPQLARIALLAEERGYDVVMLHTGRKNRRGHGETNLSLTNGKDVFTHAVLWNGRAAREMQGWEMRHPIDHAISRSKKLKVAVLWGPARFDQRSPGTSAVSIHHERKAAYAGNSISYAASVPTGPFPVPCVHQVWIGPKELHPRLAAYVDTIRAAFPSWQHRLWTEQDMQELAERSTLPDVVAGRGKWGLPGLTMGVRADVVRLEILRQHGGIYFDTDFEALRGDLRPLFDGITGFAYSDQRHGDPGIGILAAPAGNAFVEIYLRRIAGHLRAPTTAGDVLAISGPERMKECLRYWMAESWHGAEIRLIGDQRISATYRHAGITAFFAELMHPYWYGTGTWASFDPAKHPKAWAAHHWEAAWK